MITSPDNPKLKLVRKLRDRKWRERERLFVTEGEDLLSAGRARGQEPAELLSAAGSGLGGSEVDPDVLHSASALGSGTRVIALWELPETEVVHGGPALYLHGVGDPGNVGTIVRTAAALGEHDVVLGRGCADPWGPKAVRASMGAIFARPPRYGGVESTARPRLAMLAHGGEPLGVALEGLEGLATICLGSERQGLGAEVVAGCERAATIPLREGSESLNVAAIAAIAAHAVREPAGVPS